MPLTHNNNNVSSTQKINQWSFTEWSSEPVDIYIDMWQQCTQKGTSL